MKTLILYTFNVYNKNVSYFIKNGLFESKSHDFVIIYNSDNDIDICIDIPSYVKMYKRSNTGYDFGAYSDYILSNLDFINIHYNKFIFLNCSCIGPFIPRYCKNMLNWCDIFTNKLNEDVKLVGSTINACGHLYMGPDMYSHVQTWVFCIDKECLDFLIKHEIFSNKTYDRYMEVVMNKELKMSRIIINNGWNIACLYEDYVDIDFRLSNLREKYKNVEFISNIEVIILHKYLSIVDGKIARKNKDSMKQLLKQIDKYNLIFLKNNRLDIFT